MPNDRIFPTVMSPAVITIDELHAAIEEFKTNIALEIQSRIVAEGNLRPGYIAAREELRAAQAKFDAVAAPYDAALAAANEFTQEYNDGVASLQQKCNAAFPPIAKVETP